MTTTTTMTKRLPMLLAMALAACGTERKLSPTLLVELQVTPPVARIAAGLAQKLTATAVYEDGHTQDLSGLVAWSSTDAATAAVDASGLVTGAAAGSAQVAASLQGKTSVSNVAVTQAVLLSMEVVPSLLKVPIGAEVSAVAQGLLSDGSVVDLTSQVDWSTPGSGLLLETPGLARASVMGPARLVATLQELQAFVDLEVTDAAVIALAVSAARDLSALPKGVRAPLTVQATFTDGARLDVTAGATWSTNELAVALVEAGAVVGLAPGSAQLEARYQGGAASLTVTVTPAELVELVLTPPAATVPLGTFVPLRALGTYTDGSVGDLTDQATWSSADPAAVQVSNVAGQSGHAFGLIRYAQALVTAQLPGTSYSATSLVEVGAPEVTSFSIDQASKVKSRIFTAGTDLQLSATATFTDATTADATALLRWESFSPGVAMADAAVPGLVHGLSPGTATIVVTLPHNPMFWMSVEVYVR